jgi:hypothetical protein
MVILMVEPETKYAGDKITSEWANAIRTQIAGERNGHVPSYTIWGDGAAYHAVCNFPGGVDISDAHFETVFNAAVLGLPAISVKLPNAVASVVTAYTGRIAIKGVAPTITSALEVPLGCRLIVEAEGTTQQMIRNGVEGGTQIFNDQTGTAFKCLSTKGAVTSTGTVLILKNIEFVQKINLASAATPVLDLDGMAQGSLDNVQVVRDYGSDVRLTGTGIQCLQNVGGDDAGGPTMWTQVQVQGFTTGIRARIDHWESHQLDVTDCDLAMNWDVCLYNHLYGVHFFRTDKFLKVYGGFTTYGYATIDGLYLEDVDDETMEKWYMDVGFHGMLHIKGVSVDSSVSTMLWDINTAGDAKCKIWFENVVAVNSTLFPDCATPAFGDGTYYKNNQMQTVEVWATWTTITSIKINNAVRITLSNGFGTFLLRPGDTIQIYLAGGACTWNWRGISAEKYHYDD